MSQPIQPSHDPSEKRRVPLFRYFLFSVLAGLLIFSFVAWLTIPKLSGRPESLPYRTIVKITAIRNALECFRADYGHFPTAAEGLDALVDRPVDAMAKWRRYYYGDFVDAWGTPFEYLPPDKERPESFNLVSPGEDKIFGDDDDLDINSVAQPYKAMLTPMASSTAPKTSTKTLPLRDNM